jgi:hypothetical protein
VCDKLKRVPVYHFTDHAYRNWRPDHPRGYTRKREGVLPPDPEMAQDYDEAAKQPCVVFTDEIQREILVLAHQICEEEGRKLEASGFDEGHAHHVISWDGFIPWEEVHRRFKNLLALKLNRRRNTPGKRWFVRRHGAPRRVVRPEHFRYLLEIYLPDHPGLFWKRGMELPTIPDIA